ncbi:MAG: hypothetical protein GY757_30115 [bacterium]|nr:hypothetical protein [bacterium]
MKLLMEKKVLCIYIILILLVPALIEGQKTKKDQTVKHLLKLMEKEKYRKARRFCKKQQSPLKEECIRIYTTTRYKQRVKAAIKKGDFKKAETLYKKIKKKIRSNYLALLLEACIENGLIRKAAYYCRTYRYPQGYAQIGSHWLQQGDYATAEKYYTLTPLTAEKARAFGHLGDLYRKNQNPAAAKKSYDNALQQFNQLIKDQHFKWKAEYTTDRLRIIKAKEQFQRTLEEIARQKRLNRILKRSAQYCDQLKIKLFHFVCKEEIHEYVNYTVGTPLGARITNYFLYQYQIFKNKEGMEENRILLIENRKHSYRKNSPLKTQSFKHGQLIIAPIDLLSEKAQERFDYKIVGEELRDGNKEIMLEVLPNFSKKPDAEEKQDLLFGKVWIIDGEEFGISKVEWNPKYITNFDEILKLANRLKSVPDIRIYCEFDVEEFGLRFPSKYYIEEVYRQRGTRMLRAQVRVLYKKYRFFKVSTDVEVEKDY